MADSNITKRALANALMELMAEIPFDKINVAQICDRCNMNRKSFYYHFKDKFDLVNWIFDMDFLSILTFENFDPKHVSFEDRWKIIDTLCETFYENRIFYRKALKVRGQNSFSEHFRECIQPILKKRMESITGTAFTNDFTLNFFSDACVCALERWLSEKDCMPPDEFSALLKTIIQTFAISISNDIKKAFDS